MKNINTYGRLSFFLNHLFWSGIVFYNYYRLMFLPLPDMDADKSLCTLMEMIAGFALVGMVLTWKKRRNSVSIFTNVILGCALYFTISYWPVYRSQIAAMLIAAGVVLVLYIALVTVIYRQDKATVPPARCIGAAAMACRTLLGFVLGISMICTAVKPLLGMPIVESQGQAEAVTMTRPQSREDLISQNKETVLLLQESQWEAMDAAERLDVLKVIADMEAQYLGIPPVTVSSEVLKASTLGHYTHDDVTVTINLKYLVAESAKTMLRVVCHEVYHSYQHRLVELYGSLEAEQQEMYLFRQTSQYRYEFENYISGSEDYDAYFSQWCEQDSNSYATAAVEVYWAFIEPEKEPVSQ